MNKEIKFSAEALVLLYRITASCVAACTRDMEAFKKYVKELAGEGKEISYSEFVEKSPAEVVFSRDILPFVKEQKAQMISGEVILKFFGSQWHINKILSDIKEGSQEDSSLKQDSFAKGFLFDHILTLHYIREDKDGKLESCYQNPTGECLFSSHKLVVPEEAADFKLKSGDMALVHFGTVIALNLADEVVKFLYDEQEKSREFKEAVRYLTEKGK